MKLISVSVSEGDYEAFRAAAECEGQSIAGLIRDAMAFYRRERLQDRRPLERLPLLAGHQPLSELPSRATVYDEMFGDDEVIHASPSTSSPRSEPAGRHDARRNVARS